LIFPDDIVLGWEAEDLIRRYETLSSDVAMSWRLVFLYCFFLTLIVIG
jgi:hypothetical protein